MTRHSARIGVFAALVLLGMAIADGNAQNMSSSALKPLELWVVFESQTYFHFVLRNPNSVPVQFSYNPYCDFAYQVTVAGQIFTAPMPRAFEFGSPCPSVLAVRQVPAKGSLRVFSGQFSTQITEALARAKLKFSGEFRLRYSVVRSGRFTVAVFKKP